MKRPRIVPSGTSTVATSTPSEIDSNLIASRKAYEIDSAANAKEFATQNPPPPMKVVTRKRTIVRRIVHHIPKDSIDIEGTIAKMDRLHKTHSSIVPVMKEDTLVEQKTVTIVDTISDSKKPTSEPITVSNYAAGRYPIIKKRGDTSKHSSTATPKGVAKKDLVTNPKDSVARITTQETQLDSAKKLLSPGGVVIINYGTNYGIIGGTVTSSTVNINGPATKKALSKADNTTDNADIDEEVDDQESQVQELYARESMQFVKMTEPDYIEKGREKTFISITAKGSNEIRKALKGKQMRSTDAAREADYLVKHPNALVKQGYINIIPSRIGQYVLDRRPGCNGNYFHASTQDWIKNIAEVNIIYTPKNKTLAREFFKKFQ